MYAATFVAYFARSKILLTVRSRKGRTPTPSSHPSRPSFETIQDMVGSMIIEAPQDHCKAKSNVSAITYNYCRNCEIINQFKALVRDGFSCVVTGYYDYDTVSKIKGFDRTRPRTYTHCAHIFDEFTNTNISDQGDPKVQVPFLFLNFYHLTFLVQHQYASSVWTIMHRFGYKGIPGGLDGTGIHRLENVLTLDASVHLAFDALTLWFEPTVSIYILSLYTGFTCPRLFRTHHTSTRFVLETRP